MKATMTRREEDEENRSDKKLRTSGFFFPLPSVGAAALPAHVAKQSAVALRKLRLPQCIQRGITGHCLQIKQKKKKPRLFNERQTTIKRAERILWWEELVDGDEKKI